ncbi:hypothetical protein Barb7_00386 [Bacteroidales bacterium Barb7]|nr:hypothetical protein Barb7_00386 [Bacteroidales bacterium Barb7]
MEVAKQSVTGWLKLSNLDLSPPSLHKEGGRKGG